MNEPWNEKNAHKLGRSQGKEQNSLASQGWSVCSQRLFHNSPIGLVEMVHCRIPLYFFSRSAGQLWSFPWGAWIGLAFKHQLSSLCVLCLCVCRNVLFSVFPDLHLNSFTASSEGVKNRRAWGETGTEQSTLQRNKKEHTQTNFWNFLECLPNNLFID